MYRHILVPVDGSALALSAARDAVALAKTLGAKVTAFVSTPSFRYVTLDPVMSRVGPKRYEVESGRFAGRTLEAVKKLAKAARVPCSIEHAVGYPPHREILRAARRHRCDLIVMGSHGRSGVGALLLGSQANGVLTHGSVPVLVLRARRRRA